MVGLTEFEFTSNSEIIREKVILGFLLEENTSNIHFYFVRP